MLQFLGESFVLHDTEPVVISPYLFYNWGSSVHGLFSKHEVLRYGISEGQDVKREAQNLCQEWESFNIEDHVL